MINKISKLSELPDSRSYVIYFGDQIGCRPCQRFRPHFEAAEQKSSLRFFYVDVPSADKFLLDEFDVVSMPSVFHVNGDTRTRLDTNVGAFGLLSQIVDEEAKIYTPEEV